MSGIVCAPPRDSGAAATASRDRRRPAGKNNAPPEADPANRGREPARLNRFGNHIAAGRRDAGGPGNRRASTLVMTGCLISMNAGTLPQRLPENSPRDRRRSRQRPRLDTHHDRLSDLNE